MILTLTHPQDTSAYAIQEALVRKGSDVELWMITDLAQRQQVTIEIDQDNDAAWSVEDSYLSLGQASIETVWFHRPEFPVVTEALHAADRGFAEREYQEFYRWLLQLVARGAFWVNSPEAARRAESKLDQQRLAHRLGLTVPRTLYTNDPEAIREFLRDEGGQIVYKSLLMHGPWVTEDLRFANLYTSVLSTEGLPPDEVLQATPGLYQELVPKLYELRVTVIGRRVFAAKIDASKTRGGRVDWRQAYGEVRCEPAEIPAELERAILRMMEEMDLAFGAFDFILSPGGEYVFLEVNESGAFLFVEHDTKIPLLDAFCEMLLQATPEYRWDPSRATVSFPELEPAILARMDRVSKRHVQPPGHLAGQEVDDEKLATMPPAV